MRGMPFAFRKPPTDGAAWHDVASSGAATGGVATSSTGLIWSEAKLLPSGTLSKLRFTASSFTTPNTAKIGVFDSTGAKVAEGSKAVSGNGEYEITGLSFPIVAGLHKFAALSNDNTAFSISCVADTGRYDVGDVTYNTMPSTLPSSYFFDDSRLCIGAFIG